jgi:hypothetical protein
VRLRSFARAIVGFTCLWAGCGAGGAGEHADAGSAGSGGGGGGGSGAGGVPFDQCPPGLAICPDPSVCGNGVRDTCLIDVFCQHLSPLTEDCDGADLGKASCQSSGYARGVLTCTPKCSFDISRCDECASLGPSLLSCGPAPITTGFSAGIAGMGTAVGAFIDAMGIAATDTEVGLVWSEHDPDRVQFARLSPTLELLGETTLRDGEFAPGVAIAARPSGWVVAVYGQSEVSILAVDPQGQLTARTVVGQSQVPPFGGSPAAQPASDLGTFQGPPVLASEPSGATFMAWRTTGKVSTLVISSDGVTTTAPANPLGSDDSRDELSATFVGDSFYLLAQSGGGLNLVRFGVDGATKTTTTVFAQTFEGEGARLVRGSSDLQITYRGAVGGDPTELWQRIGSDGSVLSDAQVVGAELITAHGLELGTGTFLLAANSNGAGDYGQALATARVGVDGNSVSQPSNVVVVPFIPTYDIVPRGPDVVAAWVSSDADGGSVHIGLARLLP